MAGSEKTLQQQILGRGLKLKSVGSSVFLKDETIEEDQLLLMVHGDGFDDNR